MARLAALGHHVVRVRSDERRVATAGLCPNTNSEVPMERAHKIFPHGLPEPIGPDLWRVVGSLPYPLKRHMFIHRLRDGGLLLYSVVAMNEAGMAALEALGKPSVMVVPAIFHTLDVRFYKQRYPQLRVFGTVEVQAKLADVKFDGGPDALRALGVPLHLTEGMKASEIVLELPCDGGSALVFSDLVGQPEGRRGLMMRLLGPPASGGVARIFKLRQMADKEGVRRFLQRMAELPAIKLIAACHSALVRRDCSAWLRHAADGV
jgi:hypothetical protein